MDKRGFDAHIIRFIQMAIFENDTIQSMNEGHSASQIFSIISTDVFFLIWLTIMFLGAMNFFTADLKRRYYSLNLILALPLSWVPPFFFTNWDIAILSAFIFLEYIYIAWFLID